MKLTLNVSVQPKNGVRSSIAKQMYEDCDGTFSIEDVEVSSIESIISSLEEMFEILSVNLFPEVELSTLKFIDNQLEKSLNVLIRLINWAKNERGVGSKQISNILSSASSDLYRNYTNKPAIKCKVGDIIDGYFSTFLKNEISGGHIHAIVCKVYEDGMLYVVPISKGYPTNKKTRFLHFEPDIDIKYIVPYSSDGSVLFTRGILINPKRVNAVVGHATPRFFDSVLTELKETFNYT